jgi:hypothetical protein
MLRNAWILNARHHPEIQRNMTSSPIGCTSSAIHFWLHTRERVAWNPALSIPFKSFAFSELEVSRIRATLYLEILALRHQIGVLQRSATRYETLCEARMNPCGQQVNEDSVDPE